MAKFTLYSVLSKTLPFCESHTQQKRVFSKIYHFCNKYKDLEQEEFYNKLKAERICLRKRDYKHSTNPQHSRIGEGIYKGLESFSFQIDNSISEEKLKEVRRRELSYIRGLGDGKKK